MKITLFLIVVCFTATSVFSQVTEKAKKQEARLSKEAGAKLELLQQKDSLAKMVYTCPMHPKVVQDKAGKCPTCGMNLEKKSVAKVVYTCPMHAEVKQDKAGKCPKCKMNLVMKEPAKKTEPAKK
jgi:uncharacterized protein with PIN domain